MSNLGKRKFSTKFALGEKVNIDGDTSIAAVITGICIYEYAPVYDLSWFNEGVAETEKFDEFRLTTAGEPT